MPGSNYKIIALLSVKNEEWILKEYIHSIKKITNFIIAYDDNSDDNSKLILEEAGVKVISKNYTSISYFAEHQIRRELLKEGRKIGGTHFICLDADEIFTESFLNNSHEKIYSLKPGQSMWLDWIHLYKSLQIERVDGVYNKINKAFIFCDDGKSDFKYAFLGVSRIPTDPNNRILLNRKEGAVIHFQFINKDRFLIKRCWYMCSEIIKGDRSPVRINTTYDTQKDYRRKTTPIKNDALFKITDPTILNYKPENDWRLLQIYSWFDQYTIEKFEKIDIWQEPKFLLEFIRRTGKKPKPNIVPFWLLKINDLKNKTNNLLFYFKK